MSTNKLVSNSVYSFLQVLLNSISYLLVYLLVIKNLGQSKLGLWVIITALPAAVSSFGTGVSGCILKNIPEHHIQKDFKRINSLFCTGLLVNLIFSLIFCAICFINYKQLLSFILDITIVPDEYALFFKVSLITLVFNILNSVIYSVYDGLQLTYLKNKFLIVGLLLLVLLSFIFIPSQGLLSIFFAQLIQSVFIFFSLLIFLFNLKLIRIKFLTISKKDLRLFFSVGHNFQFISLTLVFFEPITKYFLNKYTGLSIVGIFELANRVLIQLRTLLVASMQVLIPYITHMNALGELSVDKIFQKLFRLSSLLAAPLFTMAFLFLVVASKQFYFENGLVFIQMALLLSIAYYINTVTSISYFILWGLSYFKSLVLSHLILIVLNVSTFYLLQNYLSGGFWIFPMAISLVISSLYTQISFNIKFPKIKISFPLKEIAFYLISLISILVAYFGVIFDKSLLFHVINMFFVIVLNSYILLSNEFLRDNFKIIISRFLRLK